MEVSACRKFQLLEHVVFFQKQASLARIWEASFYEGIVSKKRNYSCDVITRSFSLSVHRSSYINWKKPIGKSLKSYCFLIEKSWKVQKERDALFKRVVGWIEKTVHFLSCSNSVFSVVVAAAAKPSRNRRRVSEKQHTNPGIYPSLLSCI